MSICPHIDPCVVSKNNSADRLHSHANVGNRGCSIFSRGGRVEYLGLRCTFMSTYASIRFRLCFVNTTRWNVLWRRYTVPYQSADKRMCLLFQKAIPPLLDFDFLAVGNMAEKRGVPSTEEQEMEEEKQNSEKSEESEEEESDDEEYFEVEKIMARKKRNVSELWLLFQCRLLRHVWNVDIAPWNFLCTSSRLRDFRAWKCSCQQKLSADNLLVCSTAFALPVWVIFCEWKAVSGRGKSETWCVRLTVEIMRVSVLSRTLASMPSPGQVHVTWCFIVSLSAGGVYENLFTLPFFHCNTPPAHCRLHEAALLARHSLGAWKNPPRSCNHTQLWHRHSGTHTHTQITVLWYKLLRLSQLNIN